MQRLSSNLTNLPTFLNLFPICRRWESNCETHDFFLQPLFNRQVLVSVRAAAINPIDYKKPSIPVLSWGLGGKPAAQVGLCQCGGCGGCGGRVDLPHRRGLLSRKPAMHARRTFPAS